jgi:hypothetical protein
MQENNLENLLHYKMSKEEQYMVDKLFLKFSSEIYDGKLIYVNNIGFINFVFDDYKWKIVEGFPEKDFLITQIKMFFPMYYKKMKKVKEKEIATLEEWNTCFEDFDINKISDLAILEIFQGIFPIEVMDEMKAYYVFKLRNYKEKFYVRKKDFRVNKFDLLMK